MRGERVGRCGDCGAALALLAPACPGCGADAAVRAPCRDCGAVVDHAEPGSCPECRAAVSPWDAVLARARAAGFHEPLAVSVAAPHPVAAGFERGRGKPAGQDADYRLPLPDGTELHVRAYDDGYEAHLDRRSAERRVAHLARDAPLETAAGTTALSLAVLAARRLRGRERTAGGERERVSGRQRIRALAGRALDALPAGASAALPTGALAATARALRALPLSRPRLPARLRRSS